MDTTQDQINNATEAAAEPPPGNLERLVKLPFQNNWLQKMPVIAWEALVIVVMLSLSTSWISASEALGGGLAILSVTNFITFYQSDAERNETRGAAMRRAIAATAVVMYFIIISLILFSPALQRISSGTDAAGCSVATVPVTTDGDSDGEVGAVGAVGAENACVELTKTLLGRMTWMVTTIVGFYFVTSSLDDRREDPGADSDSDAADPKPDPAPPEPPAQDQPAET